MRTRIIVEYNPTYTNAPYALKRALCYVDEHGMEEGGDAFVAVSFEHVNKRRDAEEPNAASKFIQPSFTCSVCHQPHLFGVPGILDQACRAAMPEISQ